MINTSSEYKSCIREDRRFHGKAEITLADNTVLNLADDDFMLKGISIEDGTSQKGEFTIGSTIINQCTLTLNNYDGKFSKYDFTGARICPQIGLELSSTTEWLAKGKFDVYEPNSKSNVIQIIAFDNMKKFDMPFSLCTKTYPTTNLALLQQCCVDCGVTLATSTFKNSGHIISAKPSNCNVITYREVIGYIAQMAGCFARINTNGQLELKWYDFSAFEIEDNIDGGRYDLTTSTSYQSGDSKDGGNFTNYTSGDSVDGGTFLSRKNVHYIYDLSGSLTISTDDIVITGIRVTVVDDENTEHTSLYGSSGYVIEISNNPLLSKDEVSAMAASVGADIVGMRFRPMTVNTKSDPAIEAGDVAIVIDRKGNDYNTLVTNLSYSVGSSETITCDAESPLANSSTRFSEATKAMVEARKYVKSEFTKHDLAVNQLNDLLAHSFGVYRSKEILSDGSEIYYTHDKPLRADSQCIWKQTAEAFAVSNDGGQTYTSGFDANGNAVLNVLNAIGINAEWINVGTLSGVRVEVDEGKIANLEITENSLVMPQTEEYQEFKVKVGQTETIYNILKYEIKTKFLVGEEYQEASLVLGGNGFNLSFNNADNTNGCGINVYYNSDGLPILNLYSKVGQTLTDSNIQFNGTSLGSIIGTATKGWQTAMNVANFINHPELIAT